MEELYPPEKFSCTENIKLKEYFSKFASLCASNKPPNIICAPPEATSNTIQERATRLQMQKDTSIDLLAEISEEDSKANLTDSLNKTVLQTKNVRTAKMAQFYLLKDRRPKRDLFASNTDTCTEIPSYNYNEEFAVSVRIYHPFEFNFNNAKPNSYHNIKFSHEIIALGSNTLAELRDKILCFNDSEIFPEVEDPFVPLPLKPDAKKEYPSGFIFIDNVFYNDLRDPRSIDYSAGILEWAKKKRIEPLNVLAMEKTKIHQLTPRLGYPYVYLHQGKCEHIIVFTDAWLIINRSLKLSDYPRYEGVHRFHSKLCILCNLLTAKWMILNSERLPHIRSFLCDECMFSYLYKNGEKVGNFKVYQFYDKNRVI